jgi:hypothetical protein
MLKRMTAGFSGTGAAVLAAALMVLSVDGGARAEDLSCPAQAVSACRKAYRELNYAAAARATDGLEQCHNGTTLELAEALRWRGQALAAQGDVAGATRAFTLLATVAPDYALDPFVSPKVHQLFQAGRAEARLNPVLFARAIDPIRRGAHTLARIEVFGAVLRASFKFSTAEGTVEVPGRPEGTLWEAEVPGGATGTVTFRALPAAELAAAVELEALIERPEGLPELASNEPVASAAPPEATRVEDPRAPQGHAVSPWVPAAAGIFVAALGTASLIHGNDIANGVANPSSSTAQGISSVPALDSTLDSARTFQVLGVVCLSAGAASVAAAAGVWSWQGPGASPRLAALPQPGGWRVSLTSRF